MDFPPLRIPCLGEGARWNHEDSVLVQDGECLSPTGFSPQLRALTMIRSRPTTSRASLRPFPRDRLETVRSLLSRSAPAFAPARPHPTSRRGALSPNADGDCEIEGGGWWPSPWSSTEASS